MILSLRQLKQAWYSLKAKPTFILSVLTTMGITLGALLCALTLNYLLIVEPLPYPEQDRLFVAEHKLLGAQKEVKGVAFTYPSIINLYKSNEAFEQSAMMAYGRDVIISLGNQPLVNTAYVTPEFHQLLASPMALGRVFGESEALDTNNPVAILSYNTWQTEFNGRSDILEEKINLRGVSYRVIGVLSQDFIEPELDRTRQETQVWMPWDYNQVVEEQKQSYGNIHSDLNYIGKLKKGISPSQAHQVLTPLINDRWQEGVAGIDFFKGWLIEVPVRSLKEVTIGQSTSIALMLLAGIVGLLLIAIANISNLFMSRTAEKQHNMAIQAAIGATRKHLYKDALAETTLLMSMSIIVALLIAKAGFYIMQQHLGAVLPRVSELGLSPVTFGSAILVTLLLAVLFAKLSTRMIDYRALNTTLQSSGKGSGLQVSKKTRQVLIASQVAFATVLVFANFGLLKDAMKTINTPLGFTTENISTLRLSFASTDFPTSAEAAAIMSGIIEKIEALPQVDSVAQAQSPLGEFHVTALTNVADNKNFTPYYKAIDHSYFEMVEQPLLQGRSFTLADRRDSVKVMVVNRAFAKQLRPDADVLGMEISNGNTPYRIIGITQDIRVPGVSATDFDSSATGTSIPRAYVPNSLGSGSFMLKLKPGQTVSRAQLGSIIRSTDSRFSVFSYKTETEILKKKLFVEITTAVTTAVLASLVFLLAGIGIYGILSYGIQLRKFELGARMAIGATRKHIITLIINDNSKAVIVGFIGSVVLFALAYIGLSKYIQPYLTLDTLPLVFASLISISLVNIFACYWPLRPYINRPVIRTLRSSE